MKKIIVKDGGTLDRLYDGSALTFEGLAVASIPELKKWIEETMGEKMTRPEFFVIKGELMNDYYHLTGNNAYPNDLTIVSAELDSIGKNWSKLIMPRFAVGGRWFDDIVDNNARREGLDV